MRFSYKYLLLIFVLSSNILQAMLNNGDQQHKPHHYKSFFDAVIEGDITTVDSYIKQNINVNYVDTFNLTPLYCAARWGHTAIVQLLLQAHADVNIADKFGATTLFPAALNGHIHIVKMLVKHNASITQTDINAARENGYEKTARYLEQNKDDCCRILCR